MHPILAHTRCNRSSVAGGMISLHSNIRVALFPLLFSRFRESHQSMKSKEVWRFWRFLVLSSIIGNRAEISRAQQNIIQSLGVFLRYASTQTEFSWISESARVRMAVTNHVLLAPLSFFLLHISRAYLARRIVRLSSHFEGFVELPE